jgi:hypothetical protein
MQKHEGSSLDGTQEGWGEDRPTLHDMNWRTIKRVIVSFFAVSRGILFPHI